MLFSLSRRRDRRRADVDPRLAVRERPARAGPRDRRRSSRPRRDGVMRFRKRLPNDTATLLLLALFAIALLGLSDSVGDRASRHQVAISIVGAVCLLDRLRRVALVVPPLRPARRGRARGAEPRGPARSASPLALLAGRRRRGRAGLRLVRRRARPGRQGTRHLEGVHRHRHRRDRRQRGRERRRHHAGGEGKVRPRGVGGQELGRPDRLLPLPGARPALAVLLATG